MFEGVQRCPTPELQGADGSNSLPHAAQILPGLLQKPGLFSCASTTFPYAKPQHLEKRPINTKKYRRPHVFQESPCDRGCLLTFPQIPEVFYTGSQPGSCLARTQHHSPNSSEISWKAPLSPAVLPPPAPQFPFPPTLAASPRAISPPSLPSRRCHNLTATHTGSRSFQSSFPAPVHICKCRSILHPPSEPGPLGTRRGVEACEDMVSCLGEIPSPETRACRAKHSCKWHSEPREARL